MNALVTQFLDLDGTKALKREESRININLLKASGLQAERMAKIETLRQTIVLAREIGEDIPSIDFDSLCSYIGLDKVATEMIRGTKEGE